MSSQCYFQMTQVSRYPPLLSSQAAMLKQILYAFRFQATEPDAGEVQSTGWGTAMRAFHPLLKQMMWKPSPLEHGPPDVLIGKQQANSVLKEHQTTNKTVSDQLCQLSDRVYTVRMLPNQKLFWNFATKVWKIWKPILSPLRYQINSDQHNVRFRTT